MNAVQYCTKHDNSPHLVNINLKELKKATESKKKYFGREVMAGRKLVDLIKENPGYLFDFNNWQRSANSFKHATEKPYEAEGSRGFWIWGPKNTGKSHYARSISQKEYDRPPYLKDQNKWWDGYTDEPVVLLDDADKTMAEQGMTHLLKLWTDRYGCDGEVKGSHIPLHHRLFIVTSNNSIDEIWNNPN